MASNSPLKIIVEEQVDFTPPKCRYQENFNSTDHSSSSREEDCSFVLEETIKHKTSRHRKCGHCVGCLKEDCGKCRTCRDKVKYGGTGRMKQKCVYKKCTGSTSSNPVAIATYSSSEESQFNNERKRNLDIIDNNTPIRSIKRRRISCRVLSSSSPDSTIIISDEDSIVFSSPKKRFSSSLKVSTSPQKRSPHKLGSPRKNSLQSRYHLSVSDQKKRADSLNSCLASKKRFGDDSIDWSPFANLVHVRQKIEKEHDHTSDCFLQTRLRHIPLETETKTTGIRLRLGTVTNARLPKIEEKCAKTDHENNNEIISPKGLEILKRYQTLNRELIFTGKPVSCHGNQLSLLCSVKVLKKRGAILVNKTHYTIKKRRRSSRRLSIEGKENLKKIKSENSIDNSKNVPNDTTEILRLNQELWCDLYQPSNSGQVIGNQTGMSELISWLTQWKNKCQGISPPDMDPDLNDSNSLASSVQDDELCPALVITGPPGIGKTSAVYACANELGFKVLEINSTYLRTKQNMLSTLREATLSHQMTTGPVTAVSNNVESKTNKNGILSFFKSKNKSSSDGTKKTNTTATSNSNSLVLATTTLILLEEVDILYDEEVKGFWSCVYDILLSTKRPFIFTANDINLELECPYKKIVMTPPTKIQLALHCRLLALSHDCHITTEAANQIAETYDTRKLFNTLQFWLRGNNGNNKSLPPIVSGSSLLNYLPRLILSVNKKYTPTNVTTNIYKALDACIDITDTISTMDVLQFSQDTSNDFWWKSHIVDSLVDDLSDVQPLQCGGIECTRNLVDHLNELITTSLESISTNIEQRTEHIEEVKDTQKNCCEIFNIRTTLSRHSLTTDCLPVLKIICQQELARQETKQYGRRFTHYLQQHKQDHLNSLASKCILH